MISSLAVMAAAAFLQPPSCDALKALTLSKATITSVEFVAAGTAVATGRGRGGPAAPLPAHCKVAATLTPSSDSHIEMELWLPAEGWNGKFLAMGNGAWAGTIPLATVVGEPVPCRHLPAGTPPGPDLAAYAPGRRLDAAFTEGHAGMSAADA